MKTDCTEQYKLTTAFYTSPFGKKISANWSLFTARCKYFLLFLSVCLSQNHLSAQKEERLKNGVALKNLTPDAALVTCFKWLPVADVPANQVFIQTRTKGILSGIPWDIRQFKEMKKRIKRAGGKSIKYLIINELNEDRLRVLDYCRRKNIRLIADLNTAWQLAKRYGIWINIPVARDTLLQIGGRDIVLHPLGKGFASSGLAVFLPDSRLLHAGYFVASPVARYPVISPNSSFEEWAVNLEKLYFRFPDALRVVPGQGQPATVHLINRTARLVRKIYHANQHNALINSRYYTDDNKDD